MALSGETGKAWTDSEIEAVVAAYFDLLAAELRGERPTKADVVRSLQSIMPARSTGSIEFKLSNISAVLDEIHEPWIDGYKPYHNYQGALKTAVLDRINRSHRVGEVMAEYMANSLPAPTRAPRATEDILVPPPSVARRERRSSIGITTGAFGALRDLQNRRLGRAGEEFVLEAERQSLSRHGRRDLADKVEWTADVHGDGAGYDIASFRPDGSDLHIEVKTTNLGVRTPFHITRWEVAVSSIERDRWSLYRLFDFKSDPRMYRLDGPVEESARLEPTVFVGLPR